MGGKSESSSSSTQTDTTFPVQDTAGFSVGDIGGSAVAIDFSTLTAAASGDTKGNTIEGGNPFPSNNPGISSIINIDDAGTDVLNLASNIVAGAERSIALRAENDRVALRDLTELVSSTLDSGFADASEIVKSGLETSTDLVQSLFDSSNQFARDSFAVSADLAADATPTNLDTNAAIKTFAIAGVIIAGIAFVGSRL